MVLRTTPRPADKPVGRRTALVVVVACALVASAARLPTIGWSPGPDESGFTLVARQWQPSGDSPHGRYWVDRPPILIALVRLADSVGGAHGVRWVAVAGCALLVLAAAGVAREVSASGAPDARSRTVIITVVGTAALVSNPAIDLVYAKGEVLALPLLVGSGWLLLRSLRAQSALGAAGAGLLAGGALGLKQSLVGGVVFGIVMLVGARWQQRLSWRGLARLGGAFIGGALLPWVLTVAWVISAGVRLSALWYSIFGFRSDALDVILSDSLLGPLARGFDLVTVMLSSGLALLLLWFLLSLRRLGRERPVLTLATSVVLAIDLAALALGGSYWRPYLFGLVPGAVLALALLASGTPATERRPARSRVVTVVITATLVASWALTTAGWVRSWPTARQPPTAVLIGRAIAAAAQPGDTLTVLGGRADVQLASGMQSPYENLWSLPTRTRDPGGHQLSEVLAGGRAPTWFLTWADPEAWNGHAAAVVPVLARRYVKVATGCGGRELYRLRHEVRRVPSVSCRAISATRATTRP